MKSSIVLMIWSAEGAEIWHISGDKHIRIQFDETQCVDFSGERSRMRVPRSIIDQPDAPLLELHYLISERSHCASVDGYHESYMGIDESEVDGFLQCHRADGSNS